MGDKKLEFKNSLYGDALNLPCWTLTGKAENESHAWNMVICADKIYYVDSTFADQGNYISEKYVFVDSKTYSKWNRKVYDSVYVPDQFIQSGFKAKVIKSN